MISTSSHQSQCLSSYGTSRLNFKLAMPRQPTQLIDRE